ncbi:MAG: GNAT family N-acetyltransferase [Firmicutes bacterium]|nr:GNAT family N-acetyltransferase [Bacillota bacterium]
MVVIDVSGVVLETERLVLRAFRLDDLDDFYEYASVAGVGEMAGWSYHKSKTESLEILNMFISGKKEFAIVDKATVSAVHPRGKLIGSLGINESVRTQADNKIYAGLIMRELGFVLSKAYWGRGLIPEACRAVIEWLFSETNLDAITISHFIENAQSKRVIARHSKYKILSVVCLRQAKGQNFIHSRANEQHNLEQYTHL